MPQDAEHGGQSQNEIWRRADQEVRKNQPPGVKLVRTLRGHTGHIKCVVWSPDGRLLASPSDDMTIRLWDDKTGDCLYPSLQGHHATVWRVAFNHDSSILASGSSDKTIILWDVARRRQLHMLLGHKARVLSVTFDPSGRILASGSDDNTIKLWDVTSGDLVNTLPGHKGGVYSINFLPGGILVTGSGDNTIILWDWAKEKLLGTLPGHKGGTHTVAFDPVSCAILASGGADTAIRLWERASGELLRELIGHEAAVDCLDFSPDAKLIASKGNDGTVRLWDTKTYEIAAVIAEPKSDPSWMPGLAFHPRLPFLATVGSDPGTPKESGDRVIHIWEFDLAVLLWQTFERFIEKARAETKTRSFIEWAGDERVSLAIVFTDGVELTKLGETLKDDSMNEVRRAHFAQSRILIERYKGREIKTIGDCFMTAFHSVENALDYAMALQTNTGHPMVQIRAGIHIGPMTVEENDVFGGTVNFAARVVGAIKGAEIWLSERAKEDLDMAGAKRHTGLKWEQHTGIQMKGFAGEFTLWSLKK